MLHDAHPDPTPAFDREDPVRPAGIPWSPGAQSAWVSARAAARDLGADIADMIAGARTTGFSGPEFVNAASRAYVALGRGMARRLLRRLEATPERWARLERREDLSTAIGDLDALARLPENTLGHHYLRYLERHEIPVIYALLDAIEVDARARRYGWTDAERWVVRRIFEEHDLWHVVCGYSASPAGEWHLNAFSYPSLGNHATFVFGFMAPFLGRPDRGWRACLGGLYAAWRRGTRCDLFARDWRTMLRWDIDRVRDEVGLPSFEEVHPDGLAEVYLRPKHAAAARGTGA